MVLAELLDACDLFLEASRRQTKDRALRRVERELERALAKAFRAQGRKFAKGFRTLEHLFPVQESITPVDWLPLFISAATTTFELFSGPLEDAVAQALETGALAQIADIGVEWSFTLAHPRAVAYLEQYGARRVARINETTRDYLQTVIARGVDEGWSPKKMERAIIERYEEFAVGRPQEHIDSRAHMIAVTETGQAYEDGAAIVANDMQANGIRLEKKWIGPEDDRTSEACLGNMAQGWIPYDEPFSSGDDRPLNHPGCRHTLITRRVRD